MRLTRFAAAIAVLVGMAGAANAETVMKQCGDQWQAAKANGTTNGETWPQFLSQCRAQLKGAGSAAAPAPAPQQQSGSLFPWQNPAPAATAAPTSNQSVMAACGVWVNDKSHIYHFPGTHDYGNTKRGEYMFEADAQAAGNRAAKNERHP